MLGWRRWTFWVASNLVKRNTESDLHLPAGDPHFFYDQSQQLLAPIEVQIVQTRDDAVSEASDALTEPIILNEILALGSQVVEFPSESTAALIHFARARLQSAN